MLAGMAYADAFEDARKVSAREDPISDQTVQQVLNTPAVLPVFLSYRVIKPCPAFESRQRIGSHAPWVVLLAAARPLALALHDPPLPHHSKRFQLLSVYRL